MREQKMGPYYQDKWVTLYQGDCRKILPSIPDNSIDLVVTDPPYGIGFMGKDWDKALPDKKVWQECLRILKDGAFAFVMSIPRADCLSRMIISLEDAGFWVNFTPIFWAYASGFPKAMNMGKAVQKLKMGVPQGGANPLSPSHGKYKGGCSPDNIKGQGFGAGAGAYMKEQGKSFDPELTDMEAKALDGSYGGFQPKPAVEVIIVAMKPLSEKTFVDQALKNGKGITWLNDGRIPYQSNRDKEGARFGTQMDIRGGNLKTPIGIKAKDVLSSQAGRFPANLLVSDDVLNDGREWKAGGSLTGKEPSTPATNVYGEYKRHSWQSHSDSGSFSRYFDLDKWAQKTFPFLIVPKASKSEKNRGCEEMYWLNGEQIEGKLYFKLEKENKTLPQNKKHKIARGNIHPTVKPFKLVSYLITLGSREGDIVLDNFMGSGTTCVSAKALGRKCIGIDIKEENCKIAAQRCSQEAMELV